jgi:hypothetical protein
MKNSLGVPRPGADTTYEHDQSNFVKLSTSNQKQDKSVNLVAAFKRKDGKTSRTVTQQKAKSILDGWIKSIQGDDGVFEYECFPCTDKVLWLEGDLGEAPKEDQELETMVVELENSFKPITFENMMQKAFERNIGILNVLKMKPLIHAYLAQRSTLKLDRDVPVIYNRDILIPDMDNLISMQYEGLKRATFIARQTLFSDSSKDDVYKWVILKILCMHLINRSPNDNQPSLFLCGAPETGIF